MSHSKERKENNCLNCNAEIPGRYCSICGQENTEPQESVWDLITHFFNDITHFDGKFFGSVKYLLTKPGFLCAEYIKGRRASYLNPVRMYIFTSAIFFLIYFSFLAQHKEIKSESNGNTKIHNIDSGKKKEYNYRYGSGDKNTALVGDKTPYKSKEEYDSLRKAGIAKEGLLKRLLIYKNISLKEKYGNDSNIYNENLQETFQHTLPQIFFFSLPAVALFLTLLYKRRKQFYYTAHFIFALHIYVFVYIIRLVTELIKKMGTLIHLDWIEYADFLLGFTVLYYLFRAMKNFYKQGTWKTLLKFFLLLGWFFIVMLLLIIIMFAFSLYKL